MVAVILHVMKIHHCSDTEKPPSKIDDSNIPGKASSDNALIYAKLQENIYSGNAERDANTQGIVRTWHLRLDHALLLKAVRRHIKAVLLPDVTCSSFDCESWLKRIYRRRFDGSSTGSPDIGTLSVEKKGKLAFQRPIYISNSSLL